MRCLDRFGQQRVEDLVSSEVCHLPHSRPRQQLRQQTPTPPCSASNPVRRRYRAGSPLRRAAAEYVLQSIGDSFRHVRVPITQTDERSRATTDLPPAQWLTHNGTAPPPAEISTHRRRCEWTTALNSFPKRCNHSATARWGCPTSRLKPPWNTAYIESFNDRLRTECLNRKHWTSLLEARVVISDLKQEHNHRHRLASIPTIGDLPHLIEPRIKW